jgi:hypothetical protein
MPIDSTVDLSAFLNADELGVAAIYTPAVGGAGRGLRLAA